MALTLRNARKALLFMLVCITTLLISIPFIQAVVIGGWYWENPAIMFYIHPSASTFTTTAWVNTANQWTALTASNVEFTRIYGMQGASAILGEDYVAEDWDGMATIFTSNGRVVSASAVLNSYYTGSYNALKRASVASHELGHILGLGDENPSKRELMNQRTDYRYDLYKISTPQPVELHVIDNVIYREITK